MRNDDYASTIDYDDDMVAIAVKCDGITEYIEHDVEATEHGIYAALARMVPWFTGHPLEYAAGIIEQAAYDGITTFSVPTESHGPVTFTIYS